MFDFLKSAKKRQEELLAQLNQTNKCLRVLDTEMKKEGNATFLIADEEVSPTSAIWHADVVLEPKGQPKEIYSIEYLSDLREENGVSFSQTKLALWHGSEQVVRLDIGKEGLDLLTEQRNARLSCALMVHLLLRLNPQFQPIREVYRNHILTSADITKLDLFKDDMAHDPTVVTSHRTTTQIESIQRSLSLVASAADRPDAHRFLDNGHTY